MRRVSKLHFGNIGKSLSTAFLLITAIWCVISYCSTGVIYIGWEVLFGNLSVSALLSAVIYRLRYHYVLLYDSENFLLQKGRKVMKSSWRDFSSVSLFHKGYGIFTVRLYRDDIEADFVELPVSDLGLNPYAFRSEVEELISSGG